MSTTKKDVLKKPYQFCMVPFCSNSTVSSPSKIFIPVPYEPDIRKKWLDAVKRKANDVSSTVIIYCCEDHFDLSNDVENWDELNNAINLKQDVIPHKFYCQTSRNVKRKKIDDRSDDIKEEIPDAEDNIEEGIKVYKLDKFVINLNDTDNTNNINTNLRQDEEIVLRRVAYIGNDTPSTSTSEQKIKPKLTTNHTKLITLKQNNTRISYFNNNHLPLQEHNRIRTNIRLLKDNSSFYVGIPEKHIYLIDLISKELNVEEEEILLCLKKIRRDINILPLANYFGIKETFTEYCLTHRIPELARYFRRFIFWPNSEKILENLPRPFRKLYRNLESIINCLEITRPEPEDNQTKFQCWCPEKNKYIYRFFISSTPDGFINFVSSGFGGSKTDNFVMENSGYLDVIPYGKGVMIHKGFCNVNNLLFMRQCAIFWPPVMKQVRNSSNNKYIEETRKNIVLKMHTEHVVKRFQEFLIVHPNTVLHHKMIPLIDDIIIIIAGLMNLQNASYQNEMYLHK